MKIKTGDIVKIISGKYKGKTGKVLKVFKEMEKVIVEGVNIAKRHVKKGVVSKEGGIVSIERPLHVSNVMFMDDKAGRPVRLGKKVIDGKVYRISKVSGDVIETK